MEGRRVKKGYTLMELMVVVALIIILVSGIAVIRVNMKHHRKMRDEAEMVEIENLLEEYYIDNGAFPSPGEFNSLMDENGIDASRYRYTFHSSDSVSIQSVEFPELLKNLTEGS